MVAFMDVPMVRQEELGYVGAILQEHRSPSNPTLVPPKAVRQGDLAYCREVPLIGPFVHLFGQLIFNTLTTFKDSESYYHNDGKHASRIKLKICTLPYCLVAPCIGFESASSDAPERLRWSLHVMCSISSI